MYAVIKTGGKQHKVQAGDVIEIEYLHGAGDTVTFHPLLVVDDDGHTHVGKEAERAVVTAKLLGEQKGDKVKVFKYKNKSGYARRSGHRQLLTLVEIEEVTLGQPSKKAAPKKVEEPAEEPVAEPAASDEAPAEVSAQE
ncbi:MAG TPA: 50S ribosomal protein L21 [Actinomycetota bacterium]|nr:50S ribosomal protein L21 [Actinomycetota bacterium]